MSAPKASASHSLHIQIEAARVLLANFRDVLSDDAQAIADTVEGETSLHEAIEKGLRRIAEIEILETGIKATMENLKARQSRLIEQKEGLRTSLTVAMEIAALPKLETAVGTISLKKVPPKLQIVDEAAIPSRFFKPQEPRLDKIALAAALKAKEVVSGAQMDNGGLTIAILSR